MKKNAIYYGDCLRVLKDIPDESVDLIYLDPPFCSNKSYENIWKKGNKKVDLVGFDDKDKWGGGLDTYVEYMYKRLTELHRVLKDTGSIYLHCDWHANHRLRVIMDDIFGYNNFQNEIIWHYISAPEAKYFFGRKHDTILFYNKSKESKQSFNILRVPHSKNTAPVRVYKHGNKEYICNTNTGWKGDG